MKETISFILTEIRSGNSIHHSVVNAGKIVAMQSDEYLKESVLGADIINADGAGVVLAGRLLGKPFKERVTGIDLMSELMNVAHQEGLKAYFLGAKQEVLDGVVQTYEKKYSHSVIAGARNGYFSSDEELNIVNEIVESKANLLFVAMSSPLKEQFLYRHSKALSQVNFIMGVGGSFDVIAGKVKRAPKWMQKTGFEWLYRVIQEPKRMFKRYLIGNTKFSILLLKELRK